MLPESSENAQAEMLEYGSSGQSVMEMSHRSSVYDAIIKETEAALRRVLCIRIIIRWASFKAARPHSSHGAMN